MFSQNSELIWQGRSHVGDEPGVYGDASYAGLSLELPVTLRKIDAAGDDSVVLVLRTESVQTFAGYPGHLVTVIAHQTSAGDPTHSTETELTAVRLTTADGGSKDVAVDLDGIASPAHLSVRVRVDTEVPPGLYDDFVVLGLSLRSADHAYVAELGFSA
ncbi:hypothetical protein [Actinoplanes sp. NPDC049265]|uniref:hypothetical protein n=1 Tax=Actinoplanes sp. NPDC049265 TaxID=3363902 RepID=UPI003715A2BB